MMTLADRNGMLQIISDLSKEAYGFRVRKDYTNVSDEELQADWDHYIETANQRWADEAAREEQCLNEWKARIDAMSKKFGIDRHTAVKWDMQAMDMEDDFEHYLWRNGIDLRLTGELGKVLGFKVHGW
jgi:hypothetical protein